MRNWCLQCIECSRTVCNRGKPARFPVTTPPSLIIMRDYAKVNDRESAHVTATRGRWSISVEYRYKRGLPRRFRASIRLTKPTAEPHVKRNNQRNEVHRGE